MSEVKRTYENSLEFFSQNNTFNNTFISDLRSVETNQGHDFWEAPRLAFFLNCWCYALQPRDINCQYMSMSLLLHFEAFLWQFSDADLWIFLRYLVWLLVFCLPTTPTPSSCKSRAPGSTCQPPLVGTTDNLFCLAFKTPLAWQQHTFFSFVLQFFCLLLQMTGFKHSTVTHDSVKTTAEEPRGAIWADVGERADQRGRWTVKMNRLQFN